MNRKTQRVLKDANLILGLIDKAIKIGGMVWLLAVLFIVPYAQSVMNQPRQPFEPGSLVYAGASTTNSTLR